MAKKNSIPTKKGSPKTSSPKTPVDMDRLYREDVERVRRGERAILFGSLNDLPLENVYPEFEVIPGKSILSSGIVDKRSGLGVMDIKKIKDYADEALSYPNKMVKKGLENVYEEIPEKGKPYFRKVVRYLSDIPDAGLSLLAGDVINYGPGGDSGGIENKAEGGEVGDSMNGMDIKKIYREDLERVRRGEKALVFGYLNDRPLENVSPEFGLTGGLPGAGSAGVSSLLGVMKVGGKMILTPVDMAKILGHLGGEAVYKGAKMVGDGVRKVVPKVMRPLYDEAGKAIMQSSDKGLSIIGEEIVREQDLADRDASGLPPGNYANGGETLDKGKGKYVVRPGREDQDYQMATYDFIFDYLTEEKEIPKTQAIGILANIASESGGDIGATGKAGDFGIQQWLGPRKKELKRRYGEKPTLEQQLEYLVEEYRGNVPGMGWNHFNKGEFFDKDKAGNKYGYYQYSKSEFDNASNYRDATISWNQGFGRPLGSTLRNEHRISVADRFAQRYGEKMPGDQEYSYGSSYDNPVPDGGSEPGEGEIGEVTRDMRNDPAASVTSLQTWWDENGKDILERTMTMSSSNTKAIKDLTASLDKGDSDTETEEDRRRSKDEAMRNMVLGILPGIRLDIKGMSRGKS